MADGIVYHRKVSESYVCTRTIRVRIAQAYAYIDNNPRDKEATPAYVEQIWECHDYEIPNSDGGMQIFEIVNGRLTRVAGLTEVVSVEEFTGREHELNGTIAST